VRLRPGHHRLGAAERGALLGQSLRPDQPRRDLVGVALIEVACKRAAEQALQLSAAEAVLGRARLPLEAHAGQVDRLAVFAEGGDIPERVSSAGGATVYAVFVAPSNDPPITRVEDDPISCP
jgi:hypothetical protein